MPNWFKSKEATSLFAEDSNLRLRDDMGQPGAFFPVEANGRPYGEDIPNASHSASVECRDKTRQKPENYDGRLYVNGDSGTYAHDVPPLERVDTREPAADQPTGHHIHSIEPRPIHVLVAGAGLSGVALAIELQKLPNVTFQIFEKNADIGGTWYENRYAGAACDVASHAYQYTFRPNHRWTHHFAPAAEIREYIQMVCREYDVYRNTHLNTRVKSANWDDETGRWSLEVVDDRTGSASIALGDMFVNAGGILNDWKWPDLKGLADFKGTLMHSASWDESVDFSGRAVGVVGSGATGIQIVSTIQKAVRSLDLYIRSPTYVLPTVGVGIEASAFNEPYDAAEMDRFEKDPAYYAKFRKRIESQMNENFMTSRKSSVAQKTSREWAERKMREIIKSPALQEKLIPSWELGCRRVTPSLPFLKAVQEDNVQVIRSGMERITQDGVETVDGISHPCDVLICATGFDTSFIPRFNIIGRGQRSLGDVWKSNGTPEAYMGLAVAGFPNYFTFLGPNCPIANGSLVPCIESIASYVAQVVQKMQRCQIKSLEIREDLQKKFNEYIQAAHQNLVWTGSCGSWCMWLSYPRA